MARKRIDVVDEMVDVFGYDYTIGYCLCSEYNIKARAEEATDEMEKKRLCGTARSYKKLADRLMRERIENGL